MIYKIIGKIKEEVFKLPVSSESEENLIKSILNILDTQVEELKSIELAKLLALNEKFDTDHMNLSKLMSKGYVKAPTDYHRILSYFSTGVIHADSAFNMLDKEHKERILSDVVSNKAINEQLVAFRHKFNYIDFSKGHDGIDENGVVYEVKNHMYKKSKDDDRFQLGITFDRLSENNLRKLDEGRPVIILNSTDGHKLLIEMRLKFTDQLIEVYRQKLAGVKDKNTSGTKIGFNDFKHAIEEVTYICSDFESYNFSYSLLEWLNTNIGTNFDTTKKSRVCPNVTAIINDNSELIKDMKNKGNSMAKIARTLATDTAKVTPTHIKKALAS